MATATTLPAHPHPHHPSQQEHDESIGIGIEVHANGEISMVEQQQQRESSTKRSPACHASTNTTAAASAALPTNSPCPPPPDSWPQYPLLLCPTPGSGTRIRGVRYASSSTAPTSASDDAAGAGNGTSGTHMLPINTGRELPGQSLVIDFETPLFVGTLLLRIKDVVPFSKASSSTSTTSTSTSTSTSSTSSYFDGKKRKFQAVVSGKFQKQSVLKMSHCLTGQTFGRRAGRLPASYIVHGLVKFISLLAPQLQVTLHGDAPRFTSPLVSTAQTCLVHNDDTDTEGAALVDLEGELDEPPPNDPTSLLYDLSHTVATTATPSLSSSWTVATRIKHRKKVFNQLHAAAKNNKTAQNDDHAQPVFLHDKVYTFEFYQHLLHFNDTDDLKVDVGLGNLRIGLSQPLNGQPLKFMAVAAANAGNQQGGGAEQALWSFDIWHASLYPRAAEVAATTAAAAQDAAAAGSKR